ncbi:MAG: hypothetical protein ACE5FO_11175, partial [Parvularculaceae bacterium]
MVRDGVNPASTRSGARSGRAQTRRLIGALIMAAGLCLAGSCAPPRAPSKPAFHDRLEQSLNAALEDLRARYD